MNLDGEEEQVSDVQLDLLMAYRYLYYCKGISLLPDGEYDRQEKEARETADFEHQIHEVGSDRPEDYEPAVRALAVYLTYRHHPKRV